MTILLERTIFLKTETLFGGKKRICIVFIDNPDRSRSHDFSGEFETFVISE